MTGIIYSLSFQGLTGQRVTVEADVSRHMPGFVLVGLPDAAVQEARERIRSALDNSDLPFPRTKVTVNLAPADIRKAGSGYDLAIALAILRAQELLPLSDGDSEAAYLGELALDGSVRSVTGVLLMAQQARSFGIRRLYVPFANSREAANIRGIELFPVRSLSELVAHLTKEKPIDPIRASGSTVFRPSPAAFDFKDVHGQQQAKRALEIAAAGGHNILLSGVPGSGKTMLARSFISLLPPLSHDEAIEVSTIYSTAGLLSYDTPLITSRPFRAPHHTASIVSIVGGGSFPRPGEITLAHRGVLFLDEIPEFPRGVLEALRQPLEDRIVQISRAAARLQYPAHFTLVAAQNPCPCGNWGDREKTCLCTVRQRDLYQKKLSGPLLDRIDLHVRVYAVDREELLVEANRESSSAVRGRVLRARTLQANRVTEALTLNGSMSAAQLKKWCRLDRPTKFVLVEAADKLHLSARAFYKTIKIARTIADLDEREAIGKNDILEALQYRPIR